MQQERLSLAALLSLPPPPPLLNGKAGLLPVLSHLSFSLSRSRAIKQCDDAAARKIRERFRISPLYLAVLYSLSEVLHTHTRTYIYTHARAARRARARVLIDRCATNFRRAESASMCYIRERELVCS